MSLMTSISSVIPLKCWNSKHSILSSVSLHSLSVVLIHVGLKHHCLPATPTAELWTPWKAPWKCPKPQGRQNGQSCNHHLSELSSFIHSTGIYYANTEPGRVNSPLQSLSRCTVTATILSQAFISCCFLTFFLVTAKSMNKKKIKIACNSNSRDNLEMNFLPFFAYAFSIIESILCVQFWKPLIYHKHFPILLQILQNIILNG